LDPAREVVIKALEKVSKKPADAAKALGLGKKSIAEAEKNLSLWTSPTMPALERYTGTLYDALDYPTLPEVAIRRAGEQLFIQSALFGLVPALEQIPDYRLSAESKLPGLSLKKLWPEAHKLVWQRLRGPILDLRSESYVALNPIPPEYESFFVEVVDSSSGRALNHFNKKAKGAFVRSALIKGLDDLSSIPPVASEAGLGAQLDGNRVVLKVPSGF
jgi:cytoplasmic iron level regulating protein YaaA (DUF328/UPF0246 family)